MPSPALIAVDWGSTHFRAKLIVAGKVVASTASADGIRHLGGRKCEEILASHCAAWSHTHPNPEVLMSGMVGAREGWVEVPYVPAPCGLANLAAATVSVPSESFERVLIVPGVRNDETGMPATDVMRGEETQIAGLLTSLPREGAVVCLPGTHSKWVICQDGEIRSFRTWLTGEAYERLTRESLISGDGTPADPGSPAFAKGLEASGAPGGLLHQLFLGRTHMLAGRLSPPDVRSFASGLLVGHELREAIDFAADLPVHLVGDSPAAEATAAALNHLGIPHVQILEDAHLNGIQAVARSVIGDR
ncbi:MAG: 2-dehydro-3-deoxygalactonokinase [Verrucomicrobiae bacterium]|nr:2-dehydro-3-deoxygalactonokinase [Verrucomicrobiae bacterium]